MVSGFSIRPTLDIYPFGETLCMHILCVTGVVSGTLSSLGQESTDISIGQVALWYPVLYQAWDEGYRYPNWSDGAVKLYQVVGLATLCSELNEDRPWNEEYCPRLGIVVVAWNWCSCGLDESVVACIWRSITVDKVTISGVHGPGVRLRGSDWSGVMFSAK